MSRDYSNIDYQKGAILLFDGDTVQAALSAHYNYKLPHHSTNEDPIPIRALPLGKVSPGSRITSECPLSPLPSPSPPLSPATKAFTHKPRYSDFNVTFTNSLLLFPNISRREERRCHLTRLHFPTVHVSLVSTTKNRGLLTQF